VMRVPQVTDRLKEAPAQALRAVFSGVGSVLLVADRLRHRPGQETGQGNGHAARPATAPDGGSPVATAPAPTGGSMAAQDSPAAKAAKAASSAKASYAEPPAPRTPAAPPATTDSPAPAQSRGRSAKATAASATGGGETAASDTGVARAAPAKRGSGTATAKRGAAAGGSGGAAGLPLAGYDGLSVPQLRARMRTLEPAQLRALIAHERAHAGRDEVVAMFERRIAKVESGG